MSFLVRTLRQSIVQRRSVNITASLDPVQASYLNESCIEVNELDELVGPVSKKDSHMNPILHRAFSVFIFDNNKRLLMQKRSPTKITFPNVWTNSCCSHPHFNDIESSGTVGIKIAAQRKLKHELGIAEASTSSMEMHVMGRFIYRAISDDIWMEHELDYAICIPNFDAAVKPNPEEVSDVRFVSQQELSDMCKLEDVKFSPWFSLFSKFQWLDLWWSNLHRLDDFKEAKIHKLS